MKYMLFLLAVGAILCLIFAAPASAQERTGVIVQSPGVAVASTPAPGLLTAIANPLTAADEVCTASLVATNAAQAAVLTGPLQGFPTNGSNFLSLSSGPASVAPGVYTTFESTSYGGDRDTATLTVNCACPTGRSILSIESTYCTEENPTYLNTVFQDPNLIQVTDNSGTVVLDSLTVDSAAPLSNAVTGSSTVPGPPPPSPNDVVYNACLLPANRPRSVSRNLYGPVALLLRQQDAGDDILDTATFFDNLKVNCRLSIDLKPGSNPNCVNLLESRGVVSVAILGLPSFSVTTINQASILFVGASPERCAYEDVDVDGRMDLVCKFKTGDLAVGAPNAHGCTPVTLTATTAAGVPVTGSDILCRPGWYACNNSIPQTPPF